jgi:hypothetical protein
MFLTVDWIYSSPVIPVVIAQILLHRWCAPLLMADTTKLKSYRVLPMVPFLPGKNRWTVT